MLLHDLKLPGKEGLFKIETDQEMIKSITSGNPTTKNFTSQDLFFKDAIAYPGLINSHDHLDFNSFPQLGNRLYQNYTQWGSDIHQQNKDTIQHVANIPQDLRIRWGAYKNLLNGFTTIVNHGKKLLVDEGLVSVFQQNDALHSAAFEKNWKWKLNRPFRRGVPVVMHVGEGTDEKAAAEITTVTRWNWMKRKIIAVHGIAMLEWHAKKFAGLVWCPASNQFMFNQTASVQRLLSKTQVVFGTDSTLTADWNAWEHFRDASKQVNEEELVKMLTVVASSLWDLPDRGTIAEGKRADLLVIRDRGTFAASNPEDILLVMHRGEIRLIDEEIMHQLNTVALKRFSRIRLRGAMKWVQGDLPELARKIRSFHSESSFPFQYA